MTGGGNGGARRATVTVDSPSGPDPSATGRGAMMDYQEATRWEPRKS